MNKTLATLGLVALVGCTTLKREVYRTEPLTIIIDSYEGINKSYQRFTGGAYPQEKVLGFQVDHQIYSIDDDETLGHELRHIIQRRHK